jgi:NitT/TauT family transport system substrate-binding protein
MRRRHVLELAAYGAAYVALPGPARAQNATLEKIRVAAPPSDALTPLYYGLQTGAFRRAGIDLEIVLTSSGGAAVTAMTAGTYEVANTSLIAAFAAHSRGIPIVLVAPQVVYTPQNPFMLLQMAADSTYKTGADLNGKTIAVISLNAIDQLGVIEWVDKHGGDSKTLKFVEVPPSVAADAIAQHRVAAGMMFEPFLDASIAAGTTKTLADAFGAIGGTFMFAGYVSRSDWAGDHPDLVRKFLRVTEDMSAYSNTHPADTAAIMADVTKIPLSEMLKIKRVANATVLDPKMVQPLIDAAARDHIIPQSFPAADLFWNERRK